MGQCARDGTDPILFPFSNNKYGQRYILKLESHARDTVGRLDE